MASSQSTKHPRLTESGLARELDVSRQAVHQLVKRGILSKDANGLIDVEMARVALAARVHPSSKTAAAVAQKNDAATPQQPPTESQPPQSTEITSYHVAKTLREATEAQIARVKLGEMQKRFIQREPAMKQVFTAFRSLRDTIMAVSTRASVRTAAMTDAREIRATIDEELREAFATFERRTLADLSSRIGGAEPDAS